MTMSLCNYSDVYFSCSKVDAAADNHKHERDEGKTICWSKYNQIVSYAQDDYVTNEGEKRSCWYQPDEKDEITRENLKLVKTFRLSRAKAMVDAEQSFNRAGYSLRGLERYDNGGSEHLRSARSVRISILEEQSWQKHIEGRCDPTALSDLATALSLPFRAEARRRGVLDAEERCFNHVGVAEEYARGGEIQHEQTSPTHSQNHDINIGTSPLSYLQMPKTKKQKKVTFDRDIFSCQSFISDESTF